LFLIAEGTGRGRRSPSCPEILFGGFCVTDFQSLAMYIPQPIFSQLSVFLLPAPLAREVEAEVLPRNPRSRREWNSPQTFPPLLRSQYSPGRHDCRSFLSFFTPPPFCCFVFFLQTLFFSAASGVSDPPPSFGALLSTRLMTLDETLFLWANFRPLPFPRLPLY